MDKKKIQEGIRRTLRKWFVEGTNKVVFDEEKGLWLIEKHIYDNVGFVVWYDYDNKKVISVSATELTGALLDRLFYFVKGIY